MIDYDDDKPMPGSAGITQSLERSWAEVHGPEPDQVDCAIRALTEARRVLKDGAMMAAVRKRLDEQRAAVEQAAGKE